MFRLFKKGKKNDPKNMTPEEAYEAAKSFAHNRNDELEKTAAKEHEAAINTIGTSNSIGNTTANTDNAFRMTVKDTYFVEGRGTIATGTIESGKVKPNDRLNIVGYDDGSHTVVVIGIEMNKRLLASAEAGQTVGLTVRGTASRMIQSGHILTNENP